ncbi:TLDc domain-containing protein [Entamoeba marina]
MSKSRNIRYYRKSSSTNKENYVNDHLNDSLKKRVDEAEGVKELLKKYDVVFRDNDTNNIAKYTTYFNELSEIVTNKRKEIDEMEKEMKQMKFTNTELVEKIGKKKNSTNNFIDCVNRINQRIKDSKIAIYNKDMKELDNNHTERYTVENDYLNVEEMNKITNSIDLLKQWSGKQDFTILFDSIKDGGDSTTTLHDKVFGKSNLYFIVFDDCSNIFGGYLPSEINMVDMYIPDKNAFIFSLYRIGSLSKMKYLIGQDRIGKAFQLRSNDINHTLFYFGLDINVYEIGFKGSFCDRYYYRTSLEHHDLVVDYFPHLFSTRRIVVIQMS